jgi:hypothetical protein
MLGFARSLQLVATVGNLIKRRNALFANAKVIQTVGEMLRKPQYQALTRHEVVRISFSFKRPFGDECRIADGEIVSGVSNSLTDGYGDGR